MSKIAFQFGIVKAAVRCMQVMVLVAVASVVVGGNRSIGSIGAALNSLAFPGKRAPNQMVTQRRKYCLVEYRIRVPQHADHDERQAVHRHSL